MTVVLLILFAQVLFSSVQYILRKSEASLIWTGIFGSRIKINWMKKYNWWEIIYLRVLFNVVCNGQKSDSAESLNFQSYAFLGP